MARTSHGIKTFKGPLGWTWEHDSAPRSWPWWFISRSLTTMPQQNSSLLSSSIWKRASAHFLCLAAVVSFHPQTKAHELRHNRRSDEITALHATPAPHYQRSVIKRRHAKAGGARSQRENQYMTDDMILFHRMFSFFRVDTPFEFSQ